MRTINLNGLQLDAPGIAGVTIKGLRLDGWDGSPASSRQFTQRMRGPGAWGSNYPQLGIRSLSVQGMIVGQSPDVVQAALQSLMTAVDIDDFLLTVDGDGVGPRTVTVSRTSDVLVKSELIQTVKSFSVGLTAADPRKFGPTLTASTSVPSSSGGVTVPMTVPFSIPATTITGQVSMTNPGNIAGPVVITVQGPLPDFTITHVGSSGTQVFAMNQAMGADQFVVVYMESETALAQGQSSRSQWITSRGWSSFDPGPNTWSLASSGGDSRTLMTVAASPAWQ